MSKSGHTYSEWQYCHLDNIPTLNLRLGKDVLIHQANSKSDTVSYLTPTAEWVFLRLAFVREKSH